VPKIPLSSVTPRPKSASQNTKNQNLPGHQINSDIEEKLRQSAGSSVFPGKNADIRRAADEEARRKTEVFDQKKMLPKLCSRNFFGGGADDESLCFSLSATICNLGGKLALFQKYDTLAEEQAANAIVKRLGTWITNLEKPKPI
jgi:hypothetical protein